MNKEQLAQGNVISQQLAVIASLNDAINNGLSLKVKVSDSEVSFDPTGDEVNQNTYNAIKTILVSYETSLQQQFDNL